MDLSKLQFDSRLKTITIANISPRDTVEAVKELIVQGKIDPHGFQTASFSCTCSSGPMLEFIKSCPSAPFHYLRIKTINLRSVNPRTGNFYAAECAVEILKLLNLNIFESVERVLRDPDNYILGRGGGYAILIDKSGLLRWETLNGEASFVYS